MEETEEKKTEIQAVKMRARKEENEMARKMICFLYLMPYQLLGII